MGTPRANSQNPGVPAVAPERARPTAVPCWTPSLAMVESAVWSVAVVITSLKDLYFFVIGPARKYRRSLWTEILKQGVEREFFLDADVAVPHGGGEFRVP